MTNKHKKIIRELINQTQLGPEGRKSSEPKISPAISNNNILNTNVNSFDQSMSNEVMSNNVLSNRIETNNINEESANGNAVTEASHMVS